MGRRITILGMGPSAYRKADCIEQFTDGTEVWSLNNAYSVFPQLVEKKKFDRFFEIHSWEYLQSWNPGEINGNRIDHFATMSNLDCPVYVSETLPLVPDQVQMPHLDILRQFGASVEIKGSPSWMLALALLEHAHGEHIEFIQSYGIDTSDTSHANQRPSWAQWTLRSELAGIELGGTMLNFRTDPDPDEGLTGLLELKRKQLKAEA